MARVKDAAHAERSASLASTSSLSTTPAVQAAATLPSWSIRNVSGSDLIRPASRFAQHSQIPEIPRQRVAILTRKRVVIDDVLHIVDRSVQRSFIEFPLAQIAVE